MKRLNRIDFMGSGPTPTMGWSMAVLSAAALAYTASHVWSVEMDSQRLAQQRFSASSVAAIATSQAPATDALVRVTAPLRAKPASLPWSDVLSAFDQHAGSRVGLMRFEPDANDNHRLRITARARDAETLQQFMRSLQSDGRLTHVGVTEQSVDPQSGDRPLVFTLVAAWRGGQ